MRGTSHYVTVRGRVDSQSDGACATALADGGVTAPVAGGAAARGGGSRPKRPPRPRRARDVRWKGASPGGVQSAGLALPRRPAQRAHEPRAKGVVVSCRPLSCGSPLRCSPPSLAFFLVEPAPSASASRPRPPTPPPQTRCARPLSPPPPPSPTALTHSLQRLRLWSRQRPRRRRHPGCRRRQGGEVPHLPPPRRRSAWVYRSGSLRRQRPCPQR